MASPQHTARSILEAFYAAERIYMSAPADERDFSGIAATLSPDMLLVQTPALPYGGTYNGPSGMQEWATKMADFFDVVDVQDAEVFEKQGSDTIVVVSRLHLRVRKTGEELDTPFAQIIKVDLEAGLLKSIQPLYWDVHGLNRAVGHQPDA